MNRVERPELGWHRLGRAVEHGGIGLDNLERRDRAREASPGVPQLQTGAGFKYDPPTLPEPVDLTGSEDDIVAAVRRAVDV